MQKISQAQAQAELFLLHVFLSSPVTGLCLPWGKLIALCLAAAHEFNRQNIGSHLLLSRPLPLHRFFVPFPHTLLHLSIPCVHSPSPFPPLPLLLLAALLSTPQAVRNAAIFAYVAQPVGFGFREVTAHLSPASHPSPPSLWPPPPPPCTPPPPLSCLFHQPIASLLVSLPLLAS